MWSSRRCVLEVHSTPVSAAGALRACWWGWSGVNPGEQKEEETLLWTGPLLFLECFLGIRLFTTCDVQEWGGSALAFSWDCLSHFGISVIKMVLASVLWNHRNDQGRVMRARGFWRTPRMAGATGPGLTPGTTSVIWIMWKETEAPFVFVSWNVLLKHGI